LAEACQTRAIRRTGRVTQSQRPALDRTEPGPCTAHHNHPAPRRASTSPTPNGSSPPYRSSSGAPSVTATSKSRSCTPRWPSPRASPRTRKGSKPDVRRLDDTRRPAGEGFGGASVLAVCAWSRRRPTVARPGSWGLQVDRPDHDEADLDQQQKGRRPTGQGGVSLGAPDVGRPGLGCAAHHQAARIV
jgi:hypothetical protein